ncbi:MAG: pyridoxamine 5'-phosphate oxidase family protein [Verrucomicrobiales bacterium]
MHSISPAPEILERLRRMLKSPADGGAVAIFTTVSNEGWPHAAWMGTACPPDRHHLYSLTSPDSAKIRHIRKNPRTEWMLVDAERDIVLYLRGESRVLEDIKRIKKVWALFEDKSRAYFLSFFNSAPGYAVIETTTIEAEWVLPQEGQRGFLLPDQLAEPQD